MGINSNSKSSVNKKTLLERTLVTLVIIAAVRFGTFVPISGIDQSYLYQELKNSQILNFISSFSQGNFFVLGLFTLGILPNINASIVIQLLTSTFPPLQRLQKEEGEAGRRRILQITRYLTAAVALQYGFIVGFYLKPFVFGWTVFKACEIALTLTVGSLITLWFSEIITEQGLGNGTSLLVFVNISSSLPTLISNFALVEALPIKIFFASVFLVGVICIVIMQNATRKIPLLSVKSLSRSVEKTQQNYLPFKLNPSGILPLIFTSTFLNGFLAIISRVNSNVSQSNLFNTFYLLLYFFLTLFFSYFYSTIAINPIDLSKDLKRMAFTIPTISPGVATIKFLQETLNRLSLLSGLFLATIVTLPSLLFYINPSFSGLRSIGTTSLFILVGVTIDLSRQIQTYRIVESYDSIEV